MATGPSLSIEIDPEKPVSHASDTSNVTVTSADVPPVRARESPNDANIMTLPKRVSLIFMVSTPLPRDPRSPTATIDMAVRR